MNIYTTMIILAFTLASFTLILLKIPHLKFLTISLILSQLICVIDIIKTEPAQIAWMCNLTVFMNLFLIFKFHQKLFDLYFYFTWLGCFCICLIPINEYSLTIVDQPVAWIAYWIKHLIPIIMTIYFLRVQKRKLSHHSLYVGVIGFFAYSLFLYNYNKIFSKNVLYLNEPAPFMESLGPHYYWVIVPIGFLWIALLTSIVAMFRRVKSKNEYLPKEQIVKLEIEES